MEDGIDLNTKGIYRFSDPLKYLRVRVTLRKVTNNVLLEQKQMKDDASQEGREFFQMKPLTGTAAKFEVEQYTFSWQEKVFSQDEIEWYSQKREYNTFLENKYHQDVVAMIRSEVHTAKRLYSFTEADISGMEIEQPLRVHKISGTFLEDEHSTLRLRKNVNTILKSWKNQIRHSKPIVTTKKMESRHGLTIPSQCMYIMADLRSQIKNSGSALGNEYSDEVILCKIEVDSNGVLRIVPDFTREMPNCMQNNRNENFEFTISNVSQQPTKKDAEEEREFKKLLYSKYSDVRSDISSEFRMPPIEVLKSFTFSEIVSACHFDCSNLCIFYYIDLPKNWSTNDNSWLTGVTQRCKTTENCDDDAYFSFPFEGELTLSLGNIDSEDASITPPTLLMEVLSYDNWGCVRTEGYGHTLLPLLPGSYNMKVSTWRPTGNSVKSKMQHYFIGGLAELEDMTYIAVPSTFEGKEMSRLGFTTETSGTISLRIHIVQQSRNFIKSTNQKTDLLDKLTKKSQDNIALVLSAFQRARQRMLAARQKILVSK